MNCQLSSSMRQFWRCKSKIWIKNLISFEANPAEILFLPEKYLHLVHLQPIRSPPPSPHCRPICQTQLHFCARNRLLAPKLIILRYDAPRPMTNWPLTMIITITKMRWFIIFSRPYSLIASISGSGPPVMVDAIYGQILKLKYQKGWSAQMFGLISCQILSSVNHNDQSHFFQYHHLLRV